MKTPYKTRAIVLKVRDLSEKDRIITFFSPQKGVFDAVAKGVKKLTGSTIGKMEPINSVLLMLRPGKNLDTVDQVELISGFPIIRSSLDTASTALYMLDLIYRQVEREQESRELFAHLKKSLELLEKGLAPQLAGLYFEARFLCLAGYRPVTDQCVFCNKNGVFQWFSIYRGGAICNRCAENKDKNRLTALSPGASATLKHLINTGPDLIFRLSVNPRTIKELKSLLGSFIEYNLPGKPIDPAHYKNLQQ